LNIGRWRRLFCGGPSGQKARIRQIFSGCFVLHPSTSFREKCKNFPAGGKIPAEKGRGTGINPSPVSPPGHPDDFVIFLQRRRKAALILQNAVAASREGMPYLKTDAAMRT
jgi:hypothetical protein